MIFFVDLIFVEGSGVLFKVILALLSHHKDALLACDGFESIMDFLKNTVPEIDKNVLDIVIKQVSLIFRKFYSIYQICNRCSSKIEMNFSAIGMHH